MVYTPRVTRRGRLACGLMGLLSLVLFESIPVSVAAASPTIPAAATGVGPASRTPLTPLRIPPPPKSGEQWQAGVHYSVLLGARPRDVPLGKVEVQEFFMYTSPISHALQPYLKAWLKNAPDYIVFSRRPAIVFPHARLQARTYFTLLEMGREDLQDAFFDWVADKAHFPIYHTVMHPDEVGCRQLTLEFAEANRLDKSRFAQIYDSKELDDRVISTEIISHGAQVDGTSTLVVNGRYSTSVQRLIYPSQTPMPEHYARLLKLVEYLAASEVNQN